MATKHDVKRLINGMVSVLDTAGSTMGVKDGAGDAARYELAMYMMYLSASDGEIGWSETSLINDLCDLSLTPQTLGQFIREQNIYSTEFERKVPLCLQMLIAFENKLIEMNMLTDDIPDASETVLSTYKIVGQMMVNIDDDVDDNEQSDYRIYLSMLEDYVNKNALRRKKAITGFTKNTGGVSAPTKSGVSAPKKKG